MKDDKLIIYQLFPRLFSNTCTNNTPFGTIDENGSGKFNDITAAALSGIKNLGITHIWFTGILRHASLTTYPDIPADHPAVVKGRAGSPYAIKDLYDVDPDLAQNTDKRKEEWQALVERTHQQGMKVIIDFVANHVARQYRSVAKPAEVEDLGLHDDNTIAFAPQNNFYYLPGKTYISPSEIKYIIPENEPYHELPAKATGNDVFQAQPDIRDWYETVKLNYGVDYESGKKFFEPVPDTWHKMYHVLEYWLKSGVDGFRCDMAEMVPVEFWKWAIQNLKSKYPHAFFIAEIYKPGQYMKYISDGSFDYLYDKSTLYDRIRAVYSGKGNVGGISKVLHDLQDIDKNMLRFMENHDELRLASKHLMNDPFKAIPAMILTATAGKGPIMIYNGQESGERADGAAGFSGADGRTSIYDYTHMPQHQQWVNVLKYDGGKLSADQQRLRDFYKTLLKFCRNSSSIKYGKYMNLTTEEQAAKNIIIFKREYQTENILIICNFSDQQQEIRITQAPIPDLKAFRNIYEENQELIYNGEVAIVTSKANSGSIFIKN